MNYGEIQKQVDDIIAAVSSLASCGHVRYKICVHNPTFGPDYKEVAKGSNTDNANVSCPRPENFGDEAVERFTTALKREVSNENNASVYVLLTGGKGMKDVKGEYTITLREEYARPHAPIFQPVTAAPSAPAQPAMPDAASALNSLNGLLDQFFAGLGGTEGSGLSAVLSVRDGLRDEKHSREISEMRNEYERRDMQRRMDEVIRERDELKATARELEVKLKDAERLLDKNEEAISDRDDAIEELKEQIEELSKYKTAGGLAGLAVSNALANAGQTLLQRNAGGIGRLFGIDGDTMLGFLSGQEPVSPAPVAVAPTAPEPQPEVEVEVEDEDTNPRKGKADELRALLYELSEDEFRAMWHIILYLNENRDKLIAISKQMGVEE